MQNVEVICSNIDIFTKDYNLSTSEVWYRVNIDIYVELILDLLFWKVDKWSK